MQPAGVLALQGDYEAHAKALLAAGAPRVIEVRRLDQLDEIGSLVIPGGESTVMGMLLDRFGMFDALRNRIEQGLPVFGTCAGLILLARRIEGSDQTRLGVLDVTVRRNAYGRQVDSFHTDIATDIPEVGTIDGIFIRAPRILETGAGVQVLARYHGDPVLVRAGNVTAATFHPELLPGAPVHRWFLSLAAAGA